MSAAILLVEDDVSLRRIVAGAVERAGYTVIPVADGEAAQRQLDSHEFEVILLDLGLPKVDGWQLLGQLSRRQRPSVIVISARGEERDKVRALDLGADDYLPKPFGIEELLARIRAVLRRRSYPADPPRVVTAGCVTIDLGRHLVTRDGQEVVLSPTEYCLLAELARNQGVVLDHRTLLQRVWGNEYAGERNYLWTFVRRLREKLERNPASPEVVVTVGRQGYRFGGNA